MSFIQTTFIDMIAVGEGGGGYKKFSDMFIGGNVPLTVLIIQSIDYKNLTYVKKTSFPSIIPI